MATSSKAKKKTVRLASGRKRARQDLVLNAANTSLRSRFRTVVKNVVKAVTGGDKTKPVVIYCLASCWMSWNAAKRALSWGYTGTIWFPEGTDGWAEAGFPLEVRRPEAR